MQVRTGSGCSRWLKDRGFSPLAGRKIAGAAENWVSVDGRKAKVSYGLYSRTGQSSRGFAAVWGFTVTVDEVAA